MADNVTVSGASIATDDIGGAQHQRVKVTLGADGVSDGDVSDSNPMPVAAIGELIEALEAQRMALQALVKTIGLSMPNVSGQLRIALEAITTGLTLSTVTTVGTVTNITNLPTLANVTTVGTVSAVTNQAQVGGFAANPQIPSLAFCAAEGLRRNIGVT